MLLPQQEDLFILFYSAATKDQTGTRPNNRRPLEARLE